MKEERESEQCSYLLAVAVVSFLRHSSLDVGQYSAVNGFWSVEFSKGKLGASY
jgi:hypothetical protein